MLDDSDSEDFWDEVIEVELRVIMKIKQHFFKWFESFYLKTADTFLG